MFSFKEFTLTPIVKERVTEYVTLFKQTFPNYYPTKDYIDWLYFENPNGFVIGYDAYLGERLVAHYACIPIKVNDLNAKSLLSLNTATHPEFQGRGLFKALSEATFEEAFRNGLARIIGVANQFSVGGFTRHLGFNKIGNLNLRFGKINRENIGTRIYSKEEIKWISKNPRSNVSIYPHGSNVFKVSAKLKNFPVSITTNLFMDSSNELAYKNPCSLTVDWNRVPIKSIELPNRFKPSPLALIYKSLNESTPLTLESWTFIDFDMV